MLSAELVALLIHARDVAAERRRNIAQQWAEGAPQGSILVSTCHRVELYGTARSIEASGVAVDPDICIVRGDAAVRHLVSLAVGRDSTVLGEDQVLHQLRIAVHQARQQGNMPGLDRAFDLALRAGRLARSWLPANRPTLVDVALDSLGQTAGLHGAEIHVVGSGEMGKRAVAALLRRGAHPTLSNRSRENARVLGARHGLVDLDFDPGPARLAAVSGVVIAISGKWLLSVPSRRALLGSGAWVIDLSAPPALESELASKLDDRLVAIDDLALPASQSPSARTIARLDELIEQQVRAYAEWAAFDEQRAAADALTSRAREARVAELDRLWSRVPNLDAGQRAEVERAVEHLTERLLRDPLEQLGRDSDGSRARATRELFRL